VSELDRRQLLARAGQVSLVAGAATLLASGCGESEATATTPTAEASRTPNLAGLRKVVKGTVYTRSTPGFTTERTVFNTNYAGTVPLAVVRASSAADVAATIKWAAYYGVPIRARSGGHSYGGFSTVQNGVVVDLRSLNAIKVGKGSAQIGAGNNLWSVYSRLARSGVMVPGGSCPTVGFAGLALGGGMGLAGRKYGLTSDNIKGVQVVTADGKIRNATGSSASDLLWASQGGGGGNFGITTAFTMQTHTAPTVSHFRATWPWSEAESVLGAWLSFGPKSTSNLTSICSLLGQGGATPLVIVEGQYFGTQSQLQGVIAPLLRDAPGGSVSYGTTDYLGAVEYFGGCSASSCGTYSPQAFTANSSYVQKVFPSGGLRAAISAVEHLGVGSLLFDCYGGAINDVATSKTAFAHRDMLACIQFYCNGGGSTVRGWLDNAHQVLKPYVSTSAYANYIDPTLKGYQTAYYGSNLPRLRTIKKKYDPQNLFAFPQGITPAS
jgi:hypothetical protein